MEYGKSFGIATGGTLAVTGFSIGYGWIVVGVIALSVISVVAIRLFFRSRKELGQ